MLLKLYFQCLIITASLMSCSTDRADEKAAAVGKLKETGAFIISNEDRIAIVKYFGDFTDFS